MYRSRIAILMVSAIGLSALLLPLGESADAQKKGNGPQPSKVAVSPVIQREVAEGRSFVGTVRPFRTSSIGSPVSGRVEGYFVDEGDLVLGPGWFRAGQALAKLRTRTLELERDAAQSEANALAAVLEELEAGSRPEEKEQARAALAAAEAKARYARLRLSRTRNLYRVERSATEEELQEAESLAQQAEEEVRQAQAALALVMEGPRQEQIEQARARLQSQREVVERLEDRIKLHTIRAPFTGYISAEHTELGEWVTEGGLVAEMVELDAVEVEVQVVEEVIAGVKLGTEARIEVAALPDDPPFTGEVTRIVPQADPRSRTFPVKIRVENTILNGDPRLKSNMFARATLPVGAPKPALLVPKDALVFGGPTPVVYVSEPNPSDPGQATAKMVPVQLGVADGGLVEVRGALQTGQLVVVKGNARLRPDAPLLVTREITDHD